MRRSIAAIFGHEFRQHGDAVPRGVGGHLITGGHYESWGEFAGIEPAAHDRYKFLVGSLAAKDSRGNTAGENEIGAGMAARLLGSQVEHWCGGGGVNAINTALGHIFQTAAHLAIDVDGKILAFGVDTTCEFGVLGLAVLGEHPGILDVAVQIVAEHDHLRGAIQNSVENPELAGVDSVDDALALIGGIIRG